MSRRRRSRQVALQLLFQSDFNAPSAQECARFFQERLNRRADLVSFAQSLFEGVLRKRDELDRVIMDAIPNWRLSRLDAVDRNVLRLTAFEILYSDTPPKVAIDEAIELARQFGGADSPKFVNGVLDRIYRQSKRFDLGGSDAAESSISDAPHANSLDRKPG